MEEKFRCARRDTKSIRETEPFAAAILTDFDVKKRCAYVLPSIHLYVALTVIITALELAPLGAKIARESL